MAVSFHTEECTFLPQGRRRITAWIKEVITAEGYSPGDIAYIFCSPEYHIGINRQYLGHDYHTDVITFDYSDLNGTRNISGDIFIDPYTVRSNAETIGTQPQEEMMRVIIHGVLHLCGHGDKTPEEERAMRALEDRSLAAYRQANGDYPPFVLPAREGKGLRKARSTPGTARAFFRPFRRTPSIAERVPADPSFQREKPFYRSRRVCLRQPCIFSAERLTTNGQGREGISAHRTAT